MRVFCVSDIHLEHVRIHKSETFQDVQPRIDVLLDRLALPEKKLDVLILAGDIGYPLGPEYVADLEYFLTRCKTMAPHVLYIPGNHEMYVCGDNHDREACLTALRIITEKMGVTLLERSSLQIQNVWFHGCTLWSLIDPGVATNDIRYCFDDRLDFIEAFYKDYLWLRETLQTANPDQTHVVITHYLPTYDLIHPKYKKLGSTANSGFFTSILHKLDFSKVSHWFCGHTHESMMRSCLGIQCVVNPIGYPGEARDTKLLHDVSIV